MIVVLQSKGLPPPLPARLNPSLVIVSCMVLVHISALFVLISGGENLTLSGSGFGTSGAEVTIGGNECDILSQDDSEIVCTIPANRPGSFPIQLTVGVKGFADVE